MSTAIQSYKDLEVWRKGIQIVNLVYEITEQFPNKEQYNLCSQMQRSAVSIPSNIAEGFMRQHTKEYIQFAYIARSSCAELETQLIISNQRNYIDKDSFDKLNDYLDHESKMLTNLIKGLKN